jgi:CheY-like chemotaxis protein
VEGNYILYAEDDLDDQEMLTEMMSEVDSGLRLVCVKDGYDVIHYLENLSSGSNYPCIIILDINMPGLDGMQTLKLLKDNDKYKNIPVVVFSTSNSATDKEKAEALGASEFVTKPVKPSQLDNIARRFAAYCHTVPQKLP